MTTQEALKELRSRNKPYAGIMLQPNFSHMMRRIEAGLCKQFTIERFLNKFGYELVKSELEWKRKS